jgi:glycosyltransferase involved in cell wall biosynthesis
MRNLLPTFLRVVRAARESDVVHSDGAGWPFPLSFYLPVLRPFLHFRWLIVVESSFWRLEQGERSSLRQKFTHHAYGILLPLCLRLADARIFTQEEYRRSLFGREDATLVYPAVWFDADNMETPGGLAARHRRRSGSIPKAIFPARLVSEKGVETVLEAISHLEARLPAASEPLLQIDIMGEGALARRCADFAEAHRGTVTVRYVGTVPYGPAFFDLLRDNDAVIIANRKAEQPRIAFDAYSQGVPLISSRTSGIRDIAEDGVTAKLFDVGDAAGLADALKALIEDREAFHKMGHAALQTVSRYTHQEMHRVRHEFLKQTVLR